MRKSAVIAAGLLALALAGGATAYEVATIYLQPGSCRMVHGTRVCAAKGKTKTVYQVVTVTAPGTTTAPPATTTTATSGWWPDGFTPWTGAGTGPVKAVPLLAYKLAACNDSLGSTICWSYYVIANVRWSDGSTGCPGDMYAKVNELNNGVIIGYDNDLIPSIPNMQQVLLHGVVYNAPAGTMLQLAELDCTD